MGVKVRMILDSKGEKGGLLMSGNVVSVSESYAKKLVAGDRAVFYDAQRDARRVVNVDGKEMIWGDYLKIRIKQRKKAGLYGL